MIIRKGYCRNCRTNITLEIEDPALDDSRFYWAKSICCPICNLMEVGMVKE